MNCFTGMTIDVHGRLNSQFAKTVFIKIDEPYSKEVLFVQTQWESKSRIGLNAHSHQLQREETNLICTLTFVSTSSTQIDHHPSETEILACFTQCWQARTSMNSLVITLSNNTCTRITFSGQVLEATTGMIPTRSQIMTY
jgi:hypothetical protein